jgi:5'-deoxynucleotidase YfbR-like HD superfamily hydrolase
VTTRPLDFDADCLLKTLGELAIPLYKVDRNSVVPFDHERHENDAEHSFSLGIAAMCIAPKIDEELDLGLVAQYALVHDLVEIYSGDTSVYADQSARTSKHGRERAARRKIQNKFGATFPWLVHRIDEYAERRTAESNFIYALDKLLPHALVLIADHHHVKPDWHTYKRTEDVARQKIAASYPDLSEIFDELCRRYVLRPHLFSTPPDAEAVRLAGSGSPGR